jgi:hypothetical protein
MNTMKTKPKRMAKTNIVPLPDAPDIACRKTNTGDMHSLGCWYAGVDEMPSSPRITHESTQGFYHGSGRDRVLRKTRRLACLSLLDVI